jgi:hypothetical protein
LNGTLRFRVVFEIRYGRRLGGAAYRIGAGTYRRDALNGTLRFRVVFEIQTLVTGPRAQYRPVKACVGLHAAESVGV